MKYARYYSQILIKPEVYRHSFEEKKNRQIPNLMKICRDNSSLIEYLPTITGDLHQWRTQEFCSGGGNKFS